MKSQMEPLTDEIIQDGLGSIFGVKKAMLQVKSNGSWAYGRSWIYGDRCDR